MERQVFGYVLPASDPMANLLEELDAREVLGRLLAVPRYERIVREILADMDGDR